MTALRHQYLTILKGQYWHFFEEGQVGPEAVVVLMESADRALDHEETPIEDWGFLKTYIISTSFLNILRWLSQVPFMGSIFRRYLFDHFSLAYDIIVNFIEAHEATRPMFMDVNKSNERGESIMKEAEGQAKLAEVYMHSNIE